MLTRGLHRQGTLQRQQSGARRERHTRVSVFLLALTAAWAAGGVTLMATGTSPRLGWTTAAGDFEAVPTILTNAPRHLLLALLVGAIVGGMFWPGSTLLRLFKLDDVLPLERFVLAVALGLAGWDFLVLLTGWAVNVHRSTMIVVLVLYTGLPAAVSFWRKAGALRDSWGYAIAARERVRTLNRVDVVLIVSLMVCLYAAFLGSLSPEVQFDARWYHLGGPAHYVEVGHFYNIVAATHDPAQGLNPYQEILYTAFYSIGGQHAAKIFAFMDLPLLCLAVVAFTVVHFKSYRRGLAAAILLTLVPLVTWSASTASNDLPVAIYTVLAVHLFLRWYRCPRSWPYALLCLFLAAFCWGVKDFGLLTLAICCFGVVCTIFAKRTQPWRKLRGPLLLGAGMVAAACGPWWIRAGAMTGDPVFPLLYEVFPTRYWNSYAQHASSAGYRHSSLLLLPGEAVRSLVTTVTEPNAFQALMGPLFLVGLPLTVLLIFSTRRRLRTAWTLSAIFGVAWWLGWVEGGFPSSRYLIVIMPLACVCMVVAASDAYSFPRFQKSIPVVYSVVLGLISLGTFQFVVPLLPGSQSNQGAVPYYWSYLYRGEPEQDIQLIYMPMVEYVNTHLRSKDKIYDDAGLSNVYMYVKPELYNGFSYGSPTTMRQWSLSSADALNEFASHKIGYLAISHSRLSRLRRTTFAAHLKFLHAAGGMTLYQVVIGSYH